MDFEIYWTLFKPDESFENRRAATEQEWNRHPEKHEAIIAWLRQHGGYRGRNPYFFILDFQVKQPKQQVLSFKAYYERFRTTDEQGGWQRKYLPEKQATIYVKN